MTSKSDRRGTVRSADGGTVPRGDLRPSQPPRVIRSKVTPPILQASAVRRPRIDELLFELLDRNPVVCVYATAGAGKTTAVRHALDRFDGAVAWLSVDDTDGAPGRLLTYLQAALSAAEVAPADIVGAALLAGLTHLEAAGLLADSMAGTPTMIVLDDVERIIDSDEALAVIGRFAQYLPVGARMILLSRRELPLRSFPDTMMLGLDERTLAFTPEEAAEALNLLGRGEVDVRHAVEVTGGWVAGVLFEAWRSQAHTRGLSGEADPLYGYLSLHILDQLTPEQRDFLVCTSVLHEVTEDAATALGLHSAAGHLHALQSAHLPALWEHEDEVVLRCHPRFREYLLKLLGRRSSVEVQEIYRRHAAILAVAERHEEAAEELLKAGLLEEALTHAEYAIEAVMDRGDFAVARRWLTRFSALETEGTTALPAAELMMDLVTENYRGGLAVADRLAAQGLRDELARSSSRMAAALAWCYFHAGRTSDIQEVLEVAKPGPEVDAARYCMTMLDEGAAGAVAGDRNIPLSGGPLDALIMRTHYYRGRLALLLEEPASPWAVIAARPWQLGARLAMGQIGQAAALYEQERASGSAGGAWLNAVLSVQLCREQGRREDAWRLLLTGREQIRASGSLMLEAFSYVIQAELELLLNKDPAAAQSVLLGVRRHPVGGAYGFIVEQADTWLGFSYLLQDDIARAVATLRHAVASMRHSERVLMLPAAAVYLAEAEWRAGNETAADDAMDVALQAARVQGSNHSLLGAMTMFPATLSRRLDAERSSESAWHQLGRLLIARDVELNCYVGASVDIAEFGGIEIKVDGSVVRPQIKKSAELLAFLAHRPGHSATREQLLRALFGGRSDESATSYLRQAVRWLRQVLPDEDSVVVADGVVRLSSTLRVRTESAQFKRTVAEAADLPPRSRYEALRSALAMTEGGLFAAGVESPWAEERRRDLDSAILDVRCSVAELALNGGDHQTASIESNLVLRADPYRESMWRLAMRLADASGDPDGVLAAYRRCEDAMRELGTSPDHTTVCLLRDLRR